MKIVVSLLVLIAMTGLWLFVQSLNPYSDGDDEGTIVIRLIDHEGLIVLEDEHSFGEGDTLLSLLEKHYEIRTAKQALGTIILDFESVKTDFFEAFIYIHIEGILYVNGEPKEMTGKMLSLGIDSIPLIDGNVYVFEYRIPW